MLFYIIYFLNKKYFLYLEKILLKSYSDCEKTTTEFLMMLWPLY